MPENIYLQGFDHIVLQSREGPATVAPTQAYLGALPDGEQHPMTSSVLFCIPSSKLMK